MDHHEDVEDRLTPPELQRWSAPQKEEALATLADLIASTIEDTETSSTEVRRVLDTNHGNDDWRSLLLEADVEKLQQTQSRRSSAAHTADVQNLPTVPWRCPVCSAAQQVADARKLLRDRKRATDGKHALPSTPSCQKCGFSAQSAA